MTTFTEGAILNASVARVWELLRDPAVLAAAIPGCDQLEVTGPCTGRFTVTPALAAVRGTYSGEFTVIGQAGAGSVALAASGAGERGGFTIDLAMRLTARDLAGQGAQATLVRYDLSTVFSGGIAQVGQRLLTSITSRYATQFFAAIDVAAETEPPPAASAEPGQSRQRPQPRQSHQPEEPQPPRRAFVPPVRLRAVAAEDDEQPDWAGLASRTDVRVAFTVGVVIGLAGVVVATALARRRRGRW